jgi:hypothetical protein
LGSGRRPRPDPAADFYTSKLRGWNPNSDFLVLDNESLNKGVLFTDAQAAVWVRRVAANLRIPASTVFVYIGANDLRTHTWPQLEALGVKLIVASYGKNTGVRDHEPNLGGRFGGVWAGHQFSSNGTVGGVYPVDVDLFQDWAFAPVPPTPTPHQEIDMLAFTCPELLQNWNFLIAPGYLKNAPATQADHYAAEAGTTVKTWTAARVADELWNHGLGEFIPDGSPAPLKAFLLSLTGGQFRVASWLGGNRAAIVAEVLAAIAAEQAALSADFRAALAGVTLQAPVSPPEIATHVADEIDARALRRLADEPVA